MSEKKKQLVVVIACGLEDEKMSVAWSIANGGISTGLEVTVFLTSSAVDCVRKGAADRVHLNPLDPTVDSGMPALCEGKRVHRGRSPSRRDHYRLWCNPRTHQRRRCNPEFLDSYVIRLCAMSACWRVPEEQRRC
jgi:hypothetical protein